MQKVRTLLMFLGILILVSCQNYPGLEMMSTVEQPSQTPMDFVDPTKTMSPQPSVTNVIETISPFSTLPGIEPDSSLYEVINIPPGYIAGIRWPKEYEHDFVFANSGDGPGKIQWWSYDLLSKKLQTIDQAIAIEKTSTDLEEIPDGMNANLLDSFELVNISPSGRKALLLEGIGLPTATPPPNPDGEIHADAYIANVWVWEQDNLNQLGQIEVCSRNQYMWTTDEEKVTIQASPFPAPCQESNAWLADMENNVVTPLLPFETYPHGDARLVGFSPDEDRLLIYDPFPDKDDNLSSIVILDVDSGNIFKADIQARPLDWVDNSQILIDFRNTHEEVSRPGIFDIQSNEVVELLKKEQMASFEGKTIRWIELSPDKQWLVFTVDDDPYKASSLWVMALNSE
jgi:hypothetical protein